MVSFYWDILAKVPGIVVQSISTVEGGIALLAFLILLFNKQLAMRLMNWEMTEAFWWPLGQGARCRHGVRRDVRREYTARGGLCTT